MPYITTEQVAAKRQALKAAFPEYKFSVKIRDYSTIVVVIMNGPIQLLPTEKQSKGYESINEFCIDNHCEGNQPKAELLHGIQSILDQENKTEDNHPDYGRIPSFYTDLSIGKWDKPYQVKN